MSYFLAIDCGLTQIKASVFDEKGQALSLAQAQTPVNGEAIDVEKLTTNLYHVVSRAVTDAGQTVDRICISAHGNGLYYLTKDGTPYGLSSMANAPTPDQPELIQLTGQSIWGGQPLPLLRRIKDNNAEHYRNIDKIMFCKDFLVYRLSGFIGTDYSDASAAALLDAKTGRYSPDILRLHGLTDAMDKLPPLYCSHDTSAFVSKEAARMTGLREGTPICAGMFDVNACILGAGSFEDTYQLIAGTWGINAVMTETFTYCPSVTQSCLFLSSDNPMLIDSAPVSCVNLEWLMTRIFPQYTYDQANQLVCQTAFDPNLLYLPYLYPPMDMPQAKGGFVGITPHHTAGDMIRAVFEAVAFEHRRRIDKFRSAGIMRSKAVLSGGAAKSEIWCQMFADILRIPVEQTAYPQAGLLGCAIICAVANKSYENLSDAVGNMTKPRRVFYPDTDMYAVKYHNFLKEITPWITTLPERKS